MEVDDISFGPIEKEVLIKQFSDGRVGGRLVEPLIAAVFNGYICSVGGNRYDLLKNGKEQEVKVFTSSSGCNLIPSGQIGKGRKYDQNEYHKYASKKDHFIIVDIRSFPVLYMVKHSSANILNKYPGSKNKKPKVDDSIFNTQHVVNIGIIGKETITQT